MFITLVKSKETLMDNVKEQIEKYVKDFENLVQQRTELANKLNETNVAMEQIRGAVSALTALNAEEDVPVKKEKKDKK